MTTTDLSDSLRQLADLCPDIQDQAALRAAATIVDRKLREHNELNYRLSTIKVNADGS